MKEMRKMCTNNLGLCKLKISKLCVAPLQFLRAGVPLCVCVRECARKYATKLEGCQLVKPFCYF